MRSITRFMVVGILLLAVGMLIVPVAAQEGEGEGGVAVYSTFVDPATFNPIYCTGTDCRDVVDYLFIDLVAEDWDAQGYAAGVPGALASSLELAEDGRTFTLTLRDDMYWSDGTPITIDDVMFMWEVMNTPEAEYPYPYVPTEYIESVTAVDDHTLEVKMWGEICGSINNLSYLQPVPSHIFSQYDMAELDEIDWNWDPTVTSGPFLFGEYRANELTTIIGWDDYPDASMGYVNLDGMVYKVVADQTVEMEDFLSPSGEITFYEGPPPDRKADIRAAGEAGTHQVFDFTPGTSWDYMAFNMANPDNPQPRYDADGNWIEQDLHPLFSDKLVRQALNHAVDVDAIVEGAVFGEGSRMASHLVPGTWATHPTLEPYTFDTELALSMLAEAGWVPEDAAAPAGPDNPLICQGCLYATEVDPEFEGSPFEFELLTNAGNTRREAIGTIIQDQLAQLGITVDFQTIEFNTLLDIMYGQTFDAYILGWQANFPFDPDYTQLWGPDSDDPEGFGSNMTSFYNEEYVRLEQEALRVPGCDQQARAEIYYRMQEIMHDEVPYLWLYVQDGMYAARSNLGGFDPYPWLIDWNVDVWYVSAE
jgi:peptide/nickel transport system substrate-binding protein